MVVDRDSGEIQQKEKLFALSLGRNRFSTATPILSYAVHTSNGVADRSIPLSYVLHMT